ncbi:unannotated protein [freshwater metagenome]|uniref:Unannotated protein n=1 Tax=freshwater metagenome TaxID=449393 RepID=A0A6J6TLP9_9ZZZZ
MPSRAGSYPVGAPPDRAGARGGARGRAGVGVGGAPECARFGRENLDFGRFHDQNVRIQRSDGDRLLAGGSRDDLRLIPTG